MDTGQIFNLQQKEERRIKRKTLPLIPRNTHCNPDFWTIKPEKLEAEESRQKATKKKIPKAVPLISTAVYRATRVLANQHF